MTTFIDHIVSDFDKQDIPNDDNLVSSESRNSKILNVIYHVREMLISKEIIPIEPQCHILVPGSPCILCSGINQQIDIWKN